MGVFASQLVGVLDAAIRIARRDCSRDNDLLRCGSRREIVTMTRFLLALMLTGLSGAAWAQTVCTPSCDNVLTLPPGLALPLGTLPIDPIATPMVQPDPFIWNAPPACCVTFSTKGASITMDLDKGTVDLHGAKLVDAARDFWDVVALVVHRPAPASPPRYTLDEIDRMRAALEATMASAIMIDGRSACSRPDSRVLTEIGCPPADSAQVEDRLRTYMSQGVRPEELEAKVK